MVVQISKTVEKIRKLVVLMLSAITMRAHILVRVNEDSSEMEKYVRVSKHKHFNSTYV